MSPLSASIRRRLAPVIAGLAMGAALSSVEPAPALAQSFGNPFGGFLGGFLGGGYRPQRYYGGGSRHQGSRGGGSSSAGSSTNSQPSAADTSNTLAALAPPTTAEQSVLLKAIVPVSVLGSVGTTDDLQRANQTDREEDRDYTAIVADFVSKLNRRADDKGGGGRTMSDITQHAMLEALDDAIRNSLLIKFETFRDESWSPERLRVMILRRLQLELGDAMDANNAEKLTMHDVEVDIGKAAKIVQGRLFETSELLAANRNSTLFLLRLYQTHGDVSTDTRERTEQVLRRAAAEGIAPLSGLFQRDPNGYALHYRGERIIYDCLTDNIDEITSAESGVASAAEIEQRILDTNRNVCSKWVANQLVAKDGGLSTQEPVPLRVTWSAEGLKADPALFTRAPDEL